MELLISFYDSSLLVYRNTRDLCVFILYPATFLNSFISSNGCFGGMIRVLYIWYIICK